MASAGTVRKAVPSRKQQQELLRSLLEQNLNISADYISFAFLKNLKLFGVLDFRISVAVTKTPRPKHELGLCFHSTVHHQRKSGQELKQDRWGLEAGADAEARDGCCLLVCSL